MSLRAFGEHRPSLGARIYIDAAALVIGQVDLADDVSVWPMSVIRGDVNSIEIGAGTNVQDACVLHVTHAGAFTGHGAPLEVGREVTIGHRVVLHACSIGDLCLIGMGAIVMDRAVLEREVLLAAGSLVPPGKRLEAHSLYRGNPARRIRALRQDELEMLAYSAAHYVRLKDAYLESRTVARHP